MKKLDSLVQMDIIEAFMGKMWCYVALVNEHGASLGVAVANEAGYSPVPKSMCENYDEAQKLAEFLNSAMGKDQSTSDDITASSIAAGKVGA